MAGRPITRLRREGGPAPAGPLDWAQRARPGVLEVNGGRPKASERTMMDTLDDRRRRALETQEIDTEIDESEDTASLRARRRRLDRLKLDVEEQRLLKIMEKSLDGGGGDSGVADVIREMNAANNANFDRMLTLLRGNTDQQSNRELQELKTLVQNLGTQIQQVAAARQSTDDPFGVNGAMALLTASENLKSKISENLPAPAPEPGMSREQVLRQIAIEEEAEIRRAELRERREDRDFAREEARERAGTRRARLATAAGMVEQYAGPVLGAIMGSKVKDMLAPNSNGETELSTQVSPRKAYQCPECGAVNWADPAVDIATCPACGVTVHPFPRASAPDDQPHHHHDDPVMSVLPPDDDPDA
jgi:rubrerythrin